jgi:hypothetical protein
MPFVAGHKKVIGSGMRKGQMTRRSQTTADAFARVSDKYGDPLEALAALAFDPATEPALRMTGLRELCQYGYAKCKTVELLSVTEIAPDSSSLDQLLSAVERRLQEHIKQ